MADSKGGVLGSFPWASVAVLMAFVASTQLVPHAFEALRPTEKARAQAPLVPGTPDPVKDADEVVAFAKEYGVPVAIKAAFGGGGRGMKVARTIEEIPELFESATREAIAAFERSQALRPHPLTVYNIGACERALGRYTRARARLRAAIADSTLEATYANEAKAWLEQIEALLVHLTLAVSPTNAAVSIDGRRGPRRGGDRDRQEPAPHPVRRPIQNE